MRIGFHARQRNQTGAVVTYQDNPILMESVMVQSPSARGAATLYKFRGRNLITKQKVDITLKGTDNLDEADFQKRAVKMMYTDSDYLHLLDQEDYNQYALPIGDCQEQLNYLTDSLEGVLALVYQDECVGLQLPASVELNITQCDPAVRGNSATARTKLPFSKRDYKSTSRSTSRKASESKSIRGPVSSFLALDSLTIASFLVIVLRST